jgi:hypothetical protein
MSETQLRIILKSIDAALEVYSKHVGPLTAWDIRVKSMLTVIRSQVVEQISTPRVGAG